MARKKFAYGVQRDYFQEKNCIGFVREGRELGGCAVLISNADIIEGCVQYSDVFASERNSTSDRCFDSRVCTPLVIKGRASSTLFA